MNAWAAKAEARMDVYAKLIREGNAHEVIPMLLAMNSSNGKYATYLTLQVLEYMSNDKFTFALIGALGFNGRKYTEVENKYKELLELVESPFKLGAFNFLCKQKSKDAIYLAAKLFQGEIANYEFCEEFYKYVKGEEKCTS